MSKKRIGRPPRSLDEKQTVQTADGPVVVTLRERIMGLIKLGNFPLTAARACGVSEALWYKWLAAGREGKQPFQELVEAIKAAEGEAEAVAVGRINAAAKDPRHWTAAAWFLERKHPERFSQTVKVQQQVQQELDAALAKLREKLPAEEYERVLSALSDGEAGEERVVPAPGR
jgi:hypothetical protein